MTNKRYLLLSTLLSFGLVGTSLSTAGALAAENNPYPYCKYLQYQPNKAPLQPNSQSAPGAIPSGPAPGAAAPATEAPVDNTNPVPDINELLAKNTDAHEAVSKVLDAAAPRTPAQFDALYGEIFDKLARTFIEPSDLVKAGLPAFRTKYQGKIKSWIDFSAAVKDLFKQVGNRWTYVQDPADSLAQAIGQGQNLVDFGAHLHLRADGLFVIEYLEPGSTAQLGGIREGDGIESVNGKELKGLTVDEATKLLQRSEGDQLHVVSIQDGNRVEGDFTLHAPADDANQAKVDLLQNSLAYIKLSSFIDQDTFGKLMDSLIGLELNTPGGLQGIVLDLRYNGGGYVALAKILVATLNDQGIVLNEKKRDGRQIIESSTSLMPLPEIMKLSQEPEQLRAEARLRKLPLVILINGSSASASEIVTGSLKEARPNTTVMGKRSFGKFVEMTISPSPNCGKLTIESGMYTTPQGHWLQGLGITPDVVIDQPRDAKDDVQLAAAVQLLKDKTAASGANIANSTDEDRKLLGQPLEKPLEPKISTFYQWIEANTKGITLGAVAALLLLLGTGLAFITRRR
jgi:carboxyl-terminal processing protease